MKLERVKLRNFMSFGDRVQTVELDNLGLCMLTGVNQSTESSSSNGAGKSSLLEAIVYGLFGKRADGVRGDELINRRTGHNLVVEVDFVVNQIRYRVVRFRKDAKYHNKTLLYQNGRNVTARSVRATNQKLRQILGMDLATFLHSYMVGVGNTVNFTAATDKEKKAILENLAHLSLYSAAQQLAKADLKKVKNQINVTQDKLQTNQYSYRELKSLQVNAKQQQKQQLQQVQSVRAELTGLQKRLRSFPVSKERVKLLKLKRRLNRQHARVKRYQAAVKQVQGTYLTAQNQVAAWRDHLSQAKRERNDLKSTYQKLISGLNPKKAARQHVAHRHRLKSMRSKITEVTDQIKEVPVKKYQALQQHLKKLIQAQDVKVQRRQDALQQAQRRSLKINGRVKAIAQQLHTRQPQLVKLKSAYQDLVSGKAKRCFYCRQVLNVKHRRFEARQLTKQINELKDQSHKLSVNLHHATKKADVAHAAYRKLKAQRSVHHDYYAQLDSLRKQLADYRDLLNQRQNLQNDLKNKRDLGREKTRYRANQKQRADHVKQRLHQRDVKCRSLERSRSPLVKKVTQTREAYQKVNAANPEQHDYYPEFNRLTAALNDYQNGVKQRQDAQKRLLALKKFRGHDYHPKLAAARHRLAQLARHLKVLKRDSRIMTNVRDIYSDRGVKSQVLDLILPFINQQANHYLKILTDGSIKVQLSPVSVAQNGHRSDRITVKIENVSGGDRYQDSSSGEKRRIDVAIAMALQDYTRYHVRSRCNLMCVDEAFDNLDATGANRIMRILAARQRVVPNILVISHNPNLTANFSNELEVVKTDGTSVIRS